MDEETAESNYIESDDDNENSEDLLSSILGGDDQQIDPNRYQHQFTGYDSSDEEIEPPTDANSNTISIDATTNDDEINDADEGSNYLPLIDEEFGEYISIVEFSSNNDLSANGTNNNLNQTEIIGDVVDVDDKDFKILQPNSKLYLPSIPPLSTGKYNLT